MTHRSRPALTKHSLAPARTLEVYQGAAICVHADDTASSTSLCAVVATLITPCTVTTQGLDAQLHVTPEESGAIQYP